MDVFEPSSSTPPPPEDPFLETYPTKLHSSIPPSSFTYALKVYWSHDDPQSIQDKIRSAFQNLPFNYFTGTLIQFWAPVGVCGRQLLTTSDQPFALRDKYAEKHRLRCLKYHYNINVNNLQVEEDPITDGPPASAFLNRFPELLHINETIHPNPLESSALECGLKFSFVVPVFYPPQGDCVGVIECSLNYSGGLFDVFNELNINLKEQGLKTFLAQHHLPYKTICGLQIAKKEIDEALETILQTHSSPFCQVLIPYEVENQVAFSSSLHNTRTKQKLFLKLTSHNCKAFMHEESLEYLEMRSTAYDRLPIKMDELFVGKTLENYEPHFIQDISEVEDDIPRLLALFRSESFSRFVICLRSPKTGDLDYVFEFFWEPYQGRNNVILLKQLFITIMKCLPSFKYASGTDVGDKIDILDVNNSKGSKNNYIKIFQGNTASLKRGRQSKVEECSTIFKAKRNTKKKNLSPEQIESQFGQTMQEAATKLNVSLSTLKRICNDKEIQWQGKKDRSKRNVKHSYNNQNYTNEEEDQGGAIQGPSSAIIRETSLDENILTIKVEYGYTDDVIKFTLAISSATYEAIQEEIVKQFELDCAAHYKLKYLDDEDNEWILFKCDEDVRLCTKNKRNIRLRLLQRDPSGTYISTHLN